MAEIVLQFDIPGETAPSLNQWYMGGKGVMWKRRKAKDLWRVLVKQAIDLNKIKAIDKHDFPLHMFTLSCFTDQRKRDSDNWITANKLVTDALKTFKIIPEDDTRFIALSTSGVIGGAPEKMTKVYLVKQGELSKS